MPKAKKTNPQTMLRAEAVRHLLKWAVQSPLFAEKPARKAAVSRETGWRQQTANEFKRRLGWKRDEARTPYASIDYDPVAEAHQEIVERYPVDGDKHEAANISWVETDMCKSILHKHLNEFDAAEADIDDAIDYAIKVWEMVRPIIDTWTGEVLDRLTKHQDAPTENPPPLRTDGTAWTDEPEQALGYESSPHLRQQFIDDLKVLEVEAETG